MVIILAVDVSLLFVCFFFFQAEDGIRDLVRSRGLGDVYKRQAFRFLRRHLDGHRARRDRERVGEAHAFLGALALELGEDLSLIHI